MASLRRLKSNVLSTAFYMPFGLRGVEREAAEAALVQDLLCYDRVWIHTEQMNAVGMLAGIMGPRALVKALKQDALRFVHDRATIGWPKRKGFVGPVPILFIQSHPSERKPEGFSQFPAETHIQRAVLGFNLGSRTTKRIVRLTAKRTVELTLPEEVVVHERGTGTVAPATRRDLETFRPSLTDNPDSPLSLAELNRLIAKINDPHRSPLNTRQIGVPNVGAKTGAELLEPYRPFGSNEKQIALVNLFACLRFVRAYASTEGEATLHTEPLTETLLLGALADARKSASPELDDVLKVADTSLPTIEPHGEPFPYEQLLKVRQHAAARGFRKVVAKRDEQEAEELVHAYYKALQNPFGERAGVRAARFLVSTSAAALDPLAGLAVGAANAMLLRQILRRRRPAFFIDNLLPRLRGEGDRCAPPSGAKDSP